MIGSYKKYVDLRIGEPDPDLSHAQYPLGEQNSIHAGGTVREPVVGSLFDTSSFDAFLDTCAPPGAQVRAVTLWLDPANPTGFQPLPVTVRSAFSLYGRGILALILIGWPGVADHFGNGLRRILRVGRKAIGEVICFHSKRGGMAASRGLAKLHVAHLGCDLSFPGCGTRSNQVRGK
jgi:hypothetical protein